MEWLEDRGDESRPQPPPNLTPEIAARLFGKPVTILFSHPGLWERRHALLSRMPQALRTLERVERLYSDDSPKTRVAEAHEWNECRSAAETLKRLLIGYLALIHEEETS